MINIQVKGNKLDRNIPSALVYMGFIVISIILLSCCKDNTIKDIESNRYKTKKYGQDEWMIENLRVKKDKMGNAIKYYYPNEDAENASVYGLLYDFETACKLCPSGWRLPNNEEWKTLFELDKRNNASDYKDLKYWDGETNTNSSGFAIRPAGSGNNGEYGNHFQSKTLFWSKTKEDEHFVWTYIFESKKDSIRVASQHPTYAFSVRCIKEKF